MFDHQHTSGAPATDEAATELGDRRHAEHLRDNPANICIPGFNDKPYVAIEVTEIDSAHYFEVRLHDDGARGLVLASTLAHPADCAEPSCAAVWNTARQRQDRYLPTPTFILQANPNGRPFIVAIDEHLADLTFLRPSDTSMPTSTQWTCGYDVSAATAESLNAGRTPEAGPFDPSDLLQPPGDS